MAPRFITLTCFDAHHEWAEHVNPLHIGTMRDMPAGTSFLIVQGHRLTCRETVNEIQALIEDAMTRPLDPSTYEEAPAMEVPV